MIGMSNGMNIGDEFALKKATSYGTTQKRLILYFINSLQNNNPFLSFLHKKMIFYTKRCFLKLKS
jgi:hypothetical protein